MTANERIQAMGPAVPAIETFGPATIFEPLPPVPYLCEGLGLAPGAPVLIAGYGFSGKTTAAQSLALSVATGKPAWGVYGTKKGRVLHLDFEQGARLTFEKYQRLARGMGLDVEEFVASDSLRVGIHPSVYLDDANAEEVYARAIDGFSFVVLDSLKAASNTEENSSDIRRHIDALNRAADKAGAIVAMIAHARKENGNGGDAKQIIRGSGAIFDACASVFVFQGHKNKPTRVHHEKDRNRGILMDDFGLAIENVEIGGDARAGLRVVHLDKEQLAPMASDKSARYRANVINVLKTHGGRFEGSLTALRKAAGGNTAGVGDAITAMIERGELRLEGGLFVLVDPGGSGSVPKVRNHGTTQRDAVPGTIRNGSGTETVLEGSP